MSVHILRCPNCGAELQIAETSETIRCKYCGARCHVEGAGAGMHVSMIAKQIERIEGHASRTAAEIEAMRLAQARGLASQYHTDDATRRAAAAQEAAANEIAYAARLQSATHVAFVSAAQQYTAEQEAERQRVLRLRSKYRSHRAIFWVASISPFLLSAAIAVLVVLNESANTPTWARLVTVTLLAGIPLWLLASPVWITCSFLSRRYGRKFNEVAFLHGLPEVRVKSKEQEKWDKEATRIDKEWKKLGRSPKEIGAGTGCLIIVLLIGGYAVFSTFNKPANSANQNVNQPNSDAPANTPSPATNSEVKPAGNSTAPSNSPAGNTVPPANGK